MAVGQIEGDVVAVVNEGEGTGIELLIKGLGKINLARKGRTTSRSAINGEVDARILKAFAEDIFFCRRDPDV